MNLNSNARNCGTCGRACAGIEACVNQACTCASPNRVCGGTCTNVRNNPDHCGSCGNECQGDFVCNGTSCGCPGGRRECPNRAGECVASLNECCPSGQIWCGGRCVNPETDRTNCGACGTVCPGTDVCQAGRCGCTRPAGGCCVNADCSGGRVCNGSRACVCPPDTRACDGRCIGSGECCAPEVKCPNANRCVARLADCCGTCPDGQTCMNGACMGGPRSASAASAPAVQPAPKPRVRDQLLPQQPGLRPEQHLRRPSGRRLNAGTSARGGPHFATTMQRQARLALQ